MKNIRFPVWFTTFYLLFFTISALYGISPLLTLVLFLLSPVMVIWMVYSVLTKGEYHGATFNERFYEDVDYVKRPKYEVETD